MASAAIVCPFCGYKDQRAYAVQLHIEEQHTESSPFVARSEDTRGSSSRSGRPDASPGSPSSQESESSRSSMPADMWTQCTRPGCGEYVSLFEIDEHLDLHTAVALSEQEYSPPPLPPRVEIRSPSRHVPSEPRHSPSARKLQEPRSKRSGSSLSDRAASLLSSFSGHSVQSRSTVRQIQRPRNPGRLGKRELGPYAFEERMPKEVRRHLLRAGEPIFTQRIGTDGRLRRQTFTENQTEGIIPVLSDLCSLDDDNVATYLCHPCTRHVRKLYCDGNFCGYWSIQMVLTYVQHMRPRGPQELPNVIDMQDLIEEAWEDGICAYSKVETGGIRNTRKWIGSQEALAFFTRINVKAEALCIGGGEERAEYHASEDLLDHVEAYFLSGTDADRRHGTSHITRLSPIFFQRLGHSMAIIGLERKNDGSRNLLVFDSSFETSSGMARLLDGQRAYRSLDRILEPYRRSDLSLRHWQEFEIVIPRPNERPEPRT